MIRNFNKFLKIGKELFHPRLSTPLFAPFHSSQSFSKKLGIGEASVVLEDKISKISQLVHFFRFFKGFLFFSSLISSFSDDPIFFFRRMISKNSEQSFQSEMVSPECSVWPRCKPEKWWSSARVCEAWPSTSKPTMWVLWSWVTIGTKKIVTF